MSFSPHPSDDRNSLLTSIGKACTPSGLLHTENISEENLQTAKEILEQCFPDEAARRDISFFMERFVRGEREFPGDPEHHTPGATLLDQVLYRDRARKAVAVGGLYHSWDRPGGDVSLNWLGVVEAERRKGCGLEVLKDLERIAIRQGARSISVWLQAESDEPLDDPKKLAAMDKSSLSAQMRLYLSFGMLEERRFTIEWEGAACTEVWMCKPLT